MDRRKFEMNAQNAHQAGGTSSAKISSPSGVRPALAPARRAIEARRARVGIRAELQGTEAGGDQRVTGGGEQSPADAASLVLGPDEQRPDPPGVAIGGGDAEQRAVLVPDPHISARDVAAAIFHRHLAGIQQSILPHRQPQRHHLRDIGLGRLADPPCHLFCLVLVFGADHRGNHATVQRRHPLCACRLRNQRAEAHGPHGGGRSVPRRLSAPCRGRALLLLRPGAQGGRAVRGRGAGPRVDAGRMDPVVQPRRPRQARRALHPGPQPARPCLAPARARSARLQPDRHHPHHGVVRRHGHDRRVRPGAGPGLGRGDLHRQDRAHHGRSADGRAGGVSEGPPRRPARAAAAIAGHSARRRLRALRARSRVTGGAARCARHRRGRHRLPVRRPPQLPCQGAPVPDVPGAGARRATDRQAPAPDPGRLVRQRFHRDRVPRRRARLLPQRHRAFPRCAHAGGALPDLAGGRHLHLALRQHPGDLRPDADRGDGGRPAQRGHRLGRLQGHGAAWRAWHPRADPVAAAGAGRRPRRRARRRHRHLRPLLRLCQPVRRGRHQRHRRGLRVADRQRRPARQVRQRRAQGR